MTGAGDADERESLLAFPCTFPLKIIGPANDDLAPAVLEMVLRHAPDFDAATIEVRASSAGRYVSLTCTIHATSRRQLDALYRELSAHPWVRFVL